jgi:hypothetical protein
MRRRLLLCAAAILIFAASDARAQRGNDAAAAEALFAEGKKLMSAGKYSAACPKFAESQRLDPGIGTMLWLAECHAKNGQLASAWAMFKEAEALAVKSNDKRVSIAREEAAKLEPKLSKLVIDVPRSSEIDGLVVKRDGVVVGKPVWGTSLPSDSGPHEISASAPDRKPWKGTVDVPRDGGSARIQIPVLEIAPRPPEPTPFTPPPPARVQDPHAGRTQRILGVGLIGIGVAAGVVGGVFGLKAGSKRDESRDNCNANDCNAAGFAARKDALDAAQTSTILFVASGVAVVGGAVLYLTAPSSSTSVSVGARGAYVSGTF